MGEETIMLETGVQLPRRIRAWRTPTADVPFHVELEIVHRRDRVVCEHLGLRRTPKGPELTTENVRVPVKRLVGEALEAAGFQTALVQLGTRTPRRSATAPAPGSLSKGRGTPRQRRAELTLTESAAARVSRTAKAAQDGNLRDLARVYRQNAARPGPNGRPRPRQAVEEHFGLTTNQAREAIRRARREGLL